MSCSYACGAYPPTSTKYRRPPNFSSSRNETRPDKFFRRAQSATGPATPPPPANRYHALSRQWPGFTTRPADRLPIYSPFGPTLSSSVPNSSLYDTAGFHPAAFAQAEDTTPGSPGRLTRSVRVTSISTRSLHRPRIAGAVGKNFGVILKGSSKGPPKSRRPAHDSSLPLPDNPFPRSGRSIPRSPYNRNIR